MKVLVTYGTKRGGTAGLAEAVAEGLSETGHDVDVIPAQNIEGLGGWDAVVVGGALYAWFWQADARRFVKRHTQQLRELPVWFFSSGPLDESASEEEIPPTWSVKRLMTRVDARSHKTFGGRLEDESVPNLPQGDWRDFDQARAWGELISEELADLSPRTTPLPAHETQHQRALRWTLVALTLFTGVTAIAGGAELITWPEGSPWIGLDVAMLEGTPFDDFLVPGLLLFFLVGVPNLVAGVLASRSNRWAEIAGFGAGGALTVWIVTEMVLLQMAHWLQILYLAVGAATMIVAFWAWARRYLREPVTEPPTRST